MEETTKHTGLFDKNGNEVMDGDVVNITYSDSVGECHHDNNITVDVKNTRLMEWLGWSHEIEIVRHKQALNREEIKERILNKLETYLKNFCFQNSTENCNEYFDCCKCSCDHAIQKLKEILQEELPNED